MCMGGTFKMKIVTCISARGYPEWFKECIDSIEAAGIKEIHVCDDSTPIPLSDPRITTLRYNKTRVGAYVSRARVLLDLAEDTNYPDDTVIVLLDGDDKFENAEHVVPSIENAYIDPNAQVVCFHMHRENSTGGRALSLFKKRMLSVLDVWNLMPFHLRTFRLGMYRKLIEIDPEHEFGRCSDGRFVTQGTDRALLIPLILTAGPERTHIVEKHLHFYRAYLGMTHHDPSSRKNDKLFPERAKRFFPNLFS